MSLQVCVHVKVEVVVVDVHCACRCRCKFRCEHVSVNGVSVIGVIASVGVSGSVSAACVWACV